MSNGERSGASLRGDDRVLILNPDAGRADHAEAVRDLAAEHGFEVRETAEAGDAVAFARDAVPDAVLIVAAGGDGTVNEVVRGLDAADALGDVTLGIVPAGTGNNFAGNLGITGIEHAFEVIEHATVRTIDLGLADDRSFLNSCIGGLTAEASAETSSESKARLGVLAYVLATLRTAVEFDGLPLHIESEARNSDAWSGDAAFVLVGNGRRFPASGGSQADMEDGLLDVTVIEDRPAVDLVGEAAVNRLLGAETQNVVRFKSPGLSVSVLDEKPATFSLDGEMTEADALRVTTRAGALEVLVGETYEPHPDR